MQFEMCTVLMGPGLGRDVVIQVANCAVFSKPLVRLYSVTSMRTTGLGAAWAATGRVAGTMADMVDLVGDREEGARNCRTSFSAIARFFIAL